MLAASQLADHGVDNQTPRTDPSLLLQRTGGCPVHSANPPPDAEEWTDLPERTDERVQYCNKMDA